MGVSFKVAKAGTRYKPKQLQIEDSGNEDNGSVAESHFQQSIGESDFAGIGGQVADHANIMAKSGLHSVLEDLEVSFSLNLFPDGFSVGKTTEVFNNVPRQLHPYDRASKTIFAAIEQGWLPGDILDDIPCKYINGAILCEVRDYRKCLACKTGSASAENSPIIHKVMLQMCMENVVKDLLSLSHGSWTYGDLLEAESCILKVLQPDLQLNLQPSLDKNSLIKKLDLGITWSWKKRELSDPPATNLAFNNPYNIANILGTSGQNSNSKFIQTYQDRGVSCSQQNNSSSNPNLQGNNVILRIIPGSNHFASQPNCQITDSGNQYSVLNELANPSDLVSLPRQCVTNSNSDPRIASSLVVGESTLCETQAIEGPILKKPKPEPVEFSQEQLSGSQAQISLAPELQRRNNPLHQQTVAESFRRERCYVKNGSLLSQGNGQQVIVEGIPKLSAGMPTSTVKQEPAETSDYFSSEAGKGKGKSILMSPRSNQSNHQQSHLQHPSQQLRVNTPTPALTNQTDQHIGKNSRKNTGRQKRKTLMNPQVSVGARNASVSSCQSELGQSKASVPPKRRKNSAPKGLSSKVVDSLGCTGSSNEANLISLPFGILPLPQPSENKGDPFLDRFLKIKAVTQRYGLNRQKRNLDQFRERKPLFHTTSLVALHLSDCDDNGKSNNAPIGLRLSCVSKTKTSTFVRPGNETHIKLMMSEKLNERMVETRFAYHRKKEIDSKVPILFSFPSTHFADLFAAQMKSSMAREGYYLEEDRTEAALLKADGSSSSQQRGVITSGIPEVGIVNLPLPTLTPGISPLLHCSSGNMSTFNPSNLSQNLLSGSCSLPTGNIWSTLQLPANNLPKSQLDIAAQGSPMQSDWQHIMNKRAHLQFQMQERQRQQEQIMQRKAVIGGLGVAARGPGMMQLGGGVQGLGNIGLGSFSNAMGIGGSMPASVGGQRQTPWIGNLGHFNEFGNNLLSSNQSKHFSGGNAAFDDSAALIANMRRAESRGRSLLSGVPTQRSAGMVPMNASNILGMTTGNLNNQPRPQPEMYQQFHMLPQHQRLDGTMSSLLQSPEAVLLLEQVGSPPSQGSLKQFDQQSQISTQQLYPGFSLQHTNAGSTAGGPESSELSSRTHGSVGSSNANSLKLSGFRRDSSAASGGV